MNIIKIKEMGQTSQPGSWIAKCSETDHSMSRVSLFYAIPPPFDIRKQFMVFEYRWL